MTFNSYSLKCDIGCISNIKFRKLFGFFCEYFLDNCTKGQGHIKFQDSFVNCFEFLRLFNDKLELISLISLYLLPVVPN